ncbi:hypothetical protein A605_10175 [Corynebacterium halotolerans YIM 70093 = DSM 44683]|uniref:CAAX prenyl protease 2/Lysostaphin resistance protein A-like domain-containing protein n=1 Tax=Corynebacterium halotolerans YIM 70093 = DSM 44683 TaxID=1121362 RepID=M1NU85_9CORY|nr:hypothetical protein A605_10175 [Corynebacterium halotolerans YIM 70093 = DSM 44683]
MRDLLTVASIGVGLVAINITAHFTTAASWFLTMPAGVLVLVGIAKVLGLSWHDLGLSQRTLRKGLIYGGAAAASVATLVGLGLVLPTTREFFLNDAYSSMRTALLAAFILIPLQTVIPEELAFRGALHGSLARLGGARAVFIGGSVLFGLWHVASSLNLTASNSGLTALLGSGTVAQWAGVGLAVVATSVAGAGFTWLRHHTGSVIAPIALHWALNAVGALAAAAAWQFA